MRHCRRKCINGRNHLLVHVELAEDLGRIQEVLVVIDSESRLAISPKKKRKQGRTHFFALKANIGRFRTIAAQ